MRIWNLNIFSTNGNKKLYWSPNPVAAPRRYPKGPDQQDIQIISIVHTLQPLSASCQTGVSVERPIDPAWEAVHWRISATQAAKTLLQGMQRYGTIPMLTINVSRPVDQPTYCQVVLPIAFQDDDVYFSPTSTSVEGYVPSTPDSAGSAQATLSSDQSSLFKNCRKIVIC